MYMRYKHFNKSERLELSILLKKGYSLRDIAGVLGRNPSSVSRELRKNRVFEGYEPFKAQHKAYVRRKHSKYQGMKIRENPELEQYIQEKLQVHWSPEQISGRWKMETGQLLTHKAIYKYLYSAYGQSFCQYLKYKRHQRKRKKNIQSIRGAIQNRVFIDKRPEIINQRERFGDFEADTLGMPKGTRQTLVGMIERKSRCLFIKKISQLKYAIEGMKGLFTSFSQIVLSLTLDNGFENSRYAELGIPTYFCHPYSAWQKGQIENAFSLVREYIPKKKSVSAYSDQEISVIVDIINNTPRKCLNYRTPYEVFKENYENRLSRSLLLTKECCTSGYHVPPRNLITLYHTPTFKQN